MTSNVLLREYDCLYQCGSAPSEGLTIDQDSYDYLRESVLARKSDSPENDTGQGDDPGESGSPEIFRLMSRAGHECIQARNYVGLVKTPAGTNIEILPKTLGEEESSAKARNLLLKMIAVALDLATLEKDASLGSHEAPLIDALIKRFLDQTNRLVHKGLRRDYQRTASTRPYIRGRLNISKQMRQPVSKLETFHIEFDLYSIDTPENRLIKLALEKALKLSASSDNQRMAKELLPAFGQATYPNDIQYEFSRWRDRRDMVHYRPLKPWVTLLLRNLSPMLYQGQWEGVSMLFPMEQLFEKYVGFCLRKQLPRRYKITEQASRKHLVKHNRQNWFQLKPDFLVSTEGENISVLDAKWKLLDSRLGNSKDKYGMSQQDVYQLFAYGKKYLDGNRDGRSEPGAGTLAYEKKHLDGNRDMYLIYPCNRQFKKPLPVFQFTETLSLWAVPLDLDSGEVLFPQQAFKTESGLALIA